MSSVNRIKCTCKEQPIELITLTRIIRDISYFERRQTDELLHVHIKLTKHDKVNAEMAIIY